MFLISQLGSLPLGNSQGLALLLVAPIEEKNKAFEPMQMRRYCVFTNFLTADSTLKCLQHTLDMLKANC